MGDGVGRWGMWEVNGDGVGRWGMWEVNGRL